ncbi:MAG: PAS domain-containing protein [Candidatus Cloacimonetes bacterium]|nr:PAS domain-containing protein [Candidatus Cloacimonadota bacterium]
MKKDILKSVKLEKKDSYIKDLFHSSHIPLIIMNPKSNKCVDCNKAAIEIYGYKNKKELLGKSPFEISTIAQNNGDLSSLTSLIKVQEALEKGSATFKWKHQKPSGEIWDAEVQLMCVNCKGKRLLQFSFYNIIQHKQTKELMKKTLQKSRISNSILRHDITNDLVTIKSAVNIFKRTSNTKMLEEIDNRITKSLGIINNHRKQESFIEEYSAHQKFKIENVINKIANDYPDFEINISGSGNVYADEAIYSVFTNIISNSILHGKSDKMNVEIESCDKYCMVRCADFGVGIPDKIKLDVFKKGFTHGATGNTGIGLYIVKQTIEEYGGKIYFEDNHPQGTISVIQLKKVLTNKSYCSRELY